jgi:ABC-2 type transport system permease protein
VSALGQLAWFLRVFRAFVRRELVAVGGYRAAFVIRVVGALMLAATVVFFARFVSGAMGRHLDGYQGNYFGFLAVGFLVASFQQVGVSALAYRIRMAQVQGSLEAELATPAPPWMVLGAPPLHELLGAALKSAAYLWVATVVAGLRLPHVSLVGLALTIPLILAAFTGLGLLTASSTMLVRRTNPVAMLLGSLSFFLSGVVYPVAVLPHWLQAAGKLLPLTHALAALRGALLAGSSPLEMRGSLGALAIFAAVLIPSGVATFAYALRRARIDGSLGHY